MPSPEASSSAALRRARAGGWRDFFPPLMLSRRRLAGLLALLVVSGATEGAGALMLVPLLNLVHGGRGGASSSWSRLLGLPWTLPQAIGAFLAVTAVAGLLQYHRAVRTTTLQLGWIDDMRERTYAALLRANYGWLAQRRQSDLVSTLMADIGRIGVGLNALLTLAASGISTLGYLVAACVLSPGMALVAAALAALAWRMLAGIRAEAVALGHRSGLATRALHAEVHDNLGSVRLTKLVGAEAAQAARFRQATSDVRRQQLAFVRSSSRARIGTQLAGAALLAGFVWVGLRFWALPASELLTLIIIAGRLVPLLSSGQQNLNLWLNALPSLRELEELLAECEIHAEPAHDGRGSGGPSPREIALEDVVVRHPGREQPALDHVTLRLPALSTTALLGASGAGKSTCADVLAGLLVPDAGRLLLDGHPVEGADRLRWRHDVAYVTQDVVLVHDTVRRNLCWPGEPLPDDALRPAIELAAAGFVWQLPDGLETVIGDRGARLSGGERQRLGLARALLRSPRLLIVDEATSALDARSEAHVVESLARLQGRLTMLVISHRPALLALADRRAELVHGRLVDASAMETA